MKAFKMELDNLKLNYASLVSKSQTFSSNSLSFIDSLEKENELLKAKLEKLTNEQVTLQGTHVELEKSYERLVDSHVSLQVAHEVVTISVKLYQPSTHNTHAHKFKLCYLVINHVAPKQQILVLSMLLQILVKTSLIKKMTIPRKRSKS